MRGSRARKRTERFQTQEQNQEYARDPLADLVRRATLVPRSLTATRSTRASKDRCIEAKVKRRTRALAEVIGLYRGSLPPFIPAILVID
jgi:hypothetical protein